ncbi:MAG TPA: peptidoglycan-binding domain-containing protein [Candidatus Manganitrophaceae bacterium]|nr:peptidoglycan-binding domain-containing protein [Candidatus Manganitrophaceae bacterium]
MALYRRGSSGPEVRQIQERLKELEFYLGPIDGDFGGGTESAVKAFQKANRLTVDGEVGPESWKRLFPKETIPPPEIFQKPLPYRCLALTGTFETNAPPPDCFAGLSGDFDGQGLSFGVLQWNLGQETLQPLLAEMNRRHPQRLQGLLHEEYPLLTAFLKAGREEQLTWARSIQDPIRHTIFEPWRGLLKTLGRMPEFQEIEVAAAGQLYQSAKKLAKQYGLWSARAAALMFDILVQNGGISPLVRAQIMRDFEKIDPGPLKEEGVLLDEETVEVARMTIIANRRAEAADPRWIEDVRARKLCIARGRGKVHGNELDLEGQYGIGLRKE